MQNFVKKTLPETHKSKLTHYCDDYYLFVRHKVLFLGQKIVYTLQIAELQKTLFCLS